MVEEVRIRLGEWDEALDESDGYQLVVAGPGTGKTEFVVQRVARIVEAGHAGRDEILVLTFSRRAARDAGDRITRYLGGSTMPIEATTFHSLALRILEATSGGRRPSPLTTLEQIGAVKELLANEDPERWPLTYRGVLTTAGFAEEVADFLMRCSERLLSPADLAERSGARADWRALPGLYDRYLRALAESGRVDYGSLLVQAVDVLESGAGRAVAAGYRYVLVDEYQDTSPAQARLAEQLSAASGNLTVTGDPYQSIYSFRGAELRNIDDFQRRHVGVRRLVLDQSQRVPAEIMQAALRVVSSGDLPGAAGPVTPATHTGRVECYTFDQETAEAEWIAAQVERAVRVDGVEPSSIAILVRSKQEMLNEMSRALARRQVPHDRPDRRLIDHPAIQLVSDLVILALEDADPGTATPQDVDTADSAARRLLLGPLFGLSLGGQRSFWAQRHRGLTWHQILRTDDAFSDVCDLISEPGWATESSAIEGFWHLWTSLTRFAAIVESSDRIAWRKAYSSFAQVLDRQADRDPEMSLFAFFRLADDESFEAEPLFTHTSEEPRVVLTTLHQAKGLEFEQVFIANAVEGVFPDLRRSRRMLRPELLSPERTADSTAVSAFQIQEEMRLAYTAMTRARSRVVWTATEAGVDQGERRPSRFLLAASGQDTIEAIGRPRNEELEPVSLVEAEIALRRIASDPLEPPARRTSALTTLVSSPRGSWDASYFPGIAPPGPDKPILGRTFSMSPSQADGYSRCPRRYAVERRLRLGDPTSPRMTTGSLVHHALELAEKGALGSGSVHGDVADALAALRREWATADFGTAALNRAWLLKAERIVRNLYEKWPKTSAPAMALEREVELEIGGVTWYGIIDRIEQSSAGLRVIDYKTGKSLPNLDDAAVSVQLGFYALAMNAEAGPNVIAAELWFPATDAKSLTIRRLDVDRLDEVEETMLHVTAQVAAENWEPRVSADCDRCQIKSSCPAWPEGRGAYLS